MHQSGVSLIVQADVGENGDTVVAFHAALQHMRQAESGSQIIREELVRYFRFLETDDVGCRQLVQPMQQIAAEPDRVDIPVAMVRAVMRA